MHVNITRVVYDNVRIGTLRLPGFGLPSRVIVTFLQKICSAQTRGGEVCCARVLCRNMVVRVGTFVDGRSLGRLHAHRLNETSEQHGRNTFGVMPKRVVGLLLSSMP